MLRNDLPNSKTSSFNVIQVLFSMITIRIYEKSNYFNRCMSVFNMPILHQKDTNNRGTFS